MREMENGGAGRRNSSLPVGMEISLLERGVAFIPGNKPAQLFARASPTSRR